MGNILDDHLVIQVLQNNKSLDFEQWANICAEEVVGAVGDAEGYCGRTKERAGRISVCMRMEYAQNGCGMLE